MKSLHSFLLLIACQVVAFQFVLVMPVQAQDESGVLKYVMCKNGKAVRTLRVERDPRGKPGFVTQYTKAGQDEIVGEGLNRVSCEGVLERVQKTLEGAKWRCKDISNGQVHRSTAGAL